MRKRVLNSGRRRPYICQSLEGRQLLAPLYEITNLGTLGGPFPYSSAADVNDKGQVAGATYNEISETAFLYSDGSMKDLGALEGGRWSAGAGINATGQVVGVSSKMESGQS